MRPTDEQQQAIDLFRTGGNLAIEAGAGTGKTSTLVMLGESTLDEDGQYIAFNKALVDESKRKMPRNVRANTAHSLAYRALGHKFNDRLQLKLRMQSREMAERLGIKPIEMPNFEGKFKTYQPGFLANLCSRAVTSFCQSESEQIESRHFPYIDGLDAPAADGHRTYEKNTHVRALLLPYARAIWTDLQRIDGWSPYKHEHYLKAWQLAGPVIDADFILFDEAQDANPVIAAIVAAQHQSQLVYVGDSQQEIYAWTGAVNALANVDVDHRTFLTQSFRFGQAVADRANEVLSTIPDATIRLTGNPAIDSRVGPEPDPTAILSRTNSVAVDLLLKYQAEGRRPHMVGGGDDMVRFCRGALDLMSRGSTAFPELAPFGSWQEVVAYTRAEDEDGSDLKLSVDLVNAYGPSTIINALEQMPDERYADIILSTAHKSKGRQWERVKLERDFAPKPPELRKDDSVAEQRLLYVALTRAQYVLDDRITRRLDETTDNFEQEDETIAVTAPAENVFARTADQVHRRHEQLGLE